MFTSTGKALGVKGRRATSVSSTDTYQRIRCAAPPTCSSQAPPTIILALLPSYFIPLLPYAFIICCMKDSLSILLFLLTMCNALNTMDVNYSSLTTPPIPSKTFASFSASSFETFSFRTFGNDSTNFLA